MVRNFAPKWYLLAATLVAVFGLSITNSSRASIIVPESLQLSEEQLLSPTVDNSTGGAGSRSQSTTPSESDRQVDTHETDLPIFVQFLTAELPAGSTTPGGSSSSGSFSSAGLMATPLSLGDDERVGCLPGELALLLPKAPSAELFHPPRDSRS